MRKCGYCGSTRLKRVHRTLWERFSYLAIYECRECENEEFAPRQFTFHLGEFARCPRCGTTRVTKLRGPDKIDPMAPGLLNRVEKMAGGVLHHCCFCRLQFYDRRKLAPRTIIEPIPAETAGAAPSGEPDVEVLATDEARPTAPPDKPSSDE
ncbi:MAG TPA: hypothetical protein VKX45_20485 [Bryobacteraceae bacterium]|nr:hypothetical protein [Bryobacteraceae bacterium]